MGFRSTFITEHSDYGFKWPKWFVKKWSDSVNIPEKGLILSSKFEAKTYGLWMDLETDLQRIVKRTRLDRLVLVYVHECGGITRLEISPDKVRFSEPTKWKETEQVEHDYCYGCSDLKKLK